METTGAISHAMLQSNYRHQQTNTQFFYRPDALPVAQPTVSKHWREKYHIPWTCLPQAHLGVCQLCLRPLIAPGYLRGGLPRLSSALWCQYPKTYNLYSIHINCKPCKYVVETIKTTVKPVKMKCGNTVEAVKRIVKDVKCWRISFTVHIYIVGLA